MAAARGMLDKIHPDFSQQDRDDHNSYILATIAKDLLRTFKSIRFGLMVGIGGGAPTSQHDIRLGDVVATYMTEDSRVPEYLAQLVAKSPKRMKGKCSYPGTLNDRLYNAGYEHANPGSTTCGQCDESKRIKRELRDDDEPYFHYGIIASGNHLIKDGKTRLYNFPCLVIRGICDYADSHKNDVWQEYAAATAAAFAKELLLFVAPGQVLQAKKIFSELVSRTGKSTIARSVTDSFVRKDRLAAGYFFNRGEQDRNDTNRIFSTLAMQLADTVSFFKESLQESLEGLDKDAVEKTNLETQFQKLLWWPLENPKISDASRLPKVITIDALDECERPEHLVRVLELLARLCTISTLQLRVLITSRSAPEIVEAFESHLQDGTARILEIQREYPEDTKLDIQKFLRSSFAEIKNKRRVQKDPWPTINDLNRLVQLSTTPEPLFIYATTVCRFVSDKQQGPIRQLIIWLEQGSQSQLHQIYTPILDQAFLGFEEKEFCQKLRFLGTITVIARPPSTESLATILAIDLDDVSWWVSRLYAVLRVPPVLVKPIQLLHKSFADFLATSEDSDSNKYRIDVAGMQGRHPAGFCTPPQRCKKGRICLWFNYRPVPSSDLRIAALLLPHSKHTRQRFWDQRMPKTCQIQGVESKWTTGLQTFENPDGRLVLLSFSPDAHFWHLQSVKVWAVV
ncbi:vegetative incompatibility het-e-1 [Fusarium agapanthi]|uniref:Vegetative incompatibility het-e-1 n=1 Tax=Fusarium agapanthi TaxID=1803897 RepID=A0A9P5AYI7_9HYPO|nr:vegetative incompatibility het-e-1 [Fusarium agapanthi]